MSLAKYLKKVAAMEGPGGNAFIDLGKGKVLRQAEAAFQKRFNAYEDVWQLFNLKSKMRDYPIGSFYVITQPPSASMMKHAQIFREVDQGKGHGTKAYQALADHYGGIASDSSGTSRQAQGVYDKLKAGFLKDELPTNGMEPANLNGDLRRYLKGKPQRPRMGFFDEE